jgi:hypothetical protein
MITPSPGFARHELNQFSNFRSISASSCGALGLFFGSVVVALT